MAFSYQPSALDHPNGGEPPASTTLPLVARSDTISSTGGNALASQPRIAVYRTLGGLAPPPRKTPPNRRSFSVRFACYDNRSKTETTEAKP